MSPIPQRVAVKTRTVTDLVIHDADEAHGEPRVSIGMAALDHEGRTVATADANLAAADLPPTARKALATLAAWARRWRDDR